MLQPESSWNVNDFDGRVNGGAYMKWDIFFSEPACGQISIVIKTYEAHWQCMLNLRQIINYIQDFSNKCL